jgi:eukaryotic-like serine/threonine-protein kinase
MPPSTPVEIGRFLLFKSIKKGGMARVFLGCDATDPNQLVAVKTLLPKLGKQRTYREMFASEGKVGLRLTHPNIVRTLDHGEDKNTAYIAMEFIFGYDLSTVLRRLRKDARRIPIPLAVQLAHDVCAALSFAHELTDEHLRPLDIVNRDVSPGNIMVGFDGVMKLIDFGIAQTTIDVKSQIGSIKGKLSYMAPEQVRGLPVDHRCDLFSLGTVFYEMLTGLQVFHAGSDFATMERVRRAEADPPSTHNREVDAALDAICAKAMARELSDRYFTAHEMVADLADWLRTRPPVEDAQWADFMRSLFARQIDEMQSDIDGARAVATGEHRAVPGERPVPRPRLISEDTLAELTALEPEKPPAPPPEPTPAPSTVGRWLPAAILLLVLGGAAVWLAVR